MNNVSPVGTGYHYIEASYPGDGNNQAGISQTVPLLAQQVPTVLTLSANPGASTTGQPVVLTAALDQYFAQNHSASGAVSFTSNGKLLGTANVTNGTATLTTTALPFGTDNFRAAYPGDTNFVGSTSTTSAYSVRNAQTITFAPLATPAYAGTSVALTATASSGLPVTFSVLSGPATLSGNTLTYTAAGTVAIAADQAGNSTVAPAPEVVQTISVVANPVALSLTSSAATVAFGTGVTFTVKLTPTPANPTAPTGTVTYFADGVQLALPAAVLNSTAALTTSALAVGPHTITCSYSGDAIYAPATCSPLSITVTPAPTSLALTSSANPGLAFTSVAYTAALTTGGQPLQGTITFVVDNGPTPVIVPSNAAGIAVLPAGLAVGAHVLSASYHATGIYADSSAQLSETINPAPTSTTLTTATNPAQQSQTVNIVATIAAPNPPANPTPSIGNVQFFDGTTSLGSFAAQSSQPGIFFATPTSSLTVGTHAITAVFTPAGTFAPDYLPSSSTPLSLVIDPSDLNLSTTSPTLTLQTEHHGDLGVTLTSIGGLSGRFTLTCGTLPYPASCAWAGTSVYLPAGGTLTTNLHIDTDIVLGFKSSLDQTLQRPGSRLAEMLTLAALLPLGLLACTRRKRLAPLAALTVMLLAAASLTGCGDKYPDHVAPGTYTIQLNATGTPVGTSAPVTRSTTFKLVVTP